MLALAAMTIAAPAAPQIEDYAQKDLKDATFVARKVQASQRELYKINADFGTSYKFDQIRFQYKEPLKLRLEGTVEETSVLYILNGPSQIMRVPRLRVNTKQNLADAPGRRQTPLDFGVLTPSLFKNLFEGKFVRNDRATGDLVFDLTYQDRVNDNSRHRVWIDKDKGIVNKREWYNQYNRQLATFSYDAPQSVGGVWLPTRMTVRNVENKVAAITKYDTVKVNTGLSDSLFDVN